MRLVYPVCVFSRMKLPFDLTNQAFLFYVSMLLRLSASSHWMISLQAGPMRLSLEYLAPEMTNETCKYQSACLIGRLSRSTRPDQ